MDTDQFKIECCYFFEKFLLICVLDTERVQIVKESFTDLIYVPRIDIFYSFAASGLTSLQIECSAVEIVTIRATKRLKDCINVARLTYIIIVSHSISRI